ncbi:MAG: alpha-amylase family glycosyl hydrolase [Anaerolineales bacterium]
MLGVSTSEPRRRAHREYIMDAWPPAPRIFQINTWTWLYDLSQHHNRPITLGDIPEQALNILLGELGHMDAVWLMGVWQRSPAGRTIALEHPGLQAEYDRVLPDWRQEDVVGSPYSIAAYQVDERLGGMAGLATIREKLAARGLRLILDYVPNHTALDHPWVREAPDVYVHASDATRAAHPEWFFQADERWLAHGRDPYFPPWTDTAQVNAFSPGARRVARETLQHIATLCDGVRCDMAMLLTHEVFAQTWGDLAGPPPEVEFWEEIIPAVRETNTDFLFMAEVYWDMEHALQEQGFDYCYDKRLYDRLVHGSAAAVRTHLIADINYQQKLVRFTENHDEPRAASTMHPAQNIAATVLCATLPGAHLIHEGQMRGHQVKLPVQLGRRPIEKDDPVLLSVYRALLERLPARENLKKWELLQVTDMNGNEHPTLIAHIWTENMDLLTVVNYSTQSASGSVKLPSRYDNSAFIDLMTGEVWNMPGVSAFYITLPAWGWIILTT